MEEHSLTYEIARDLTVVLIEKGYFMVDNDVRKNPESVAKEVAEFYNAIAENLNIR